MANFGVMEVVGIHIFLNQRQWNTINTANQYHSCFGIWFTTVNQAPCHYVININSTQYFAGSLPIFHKKKQKNSCIKE